MTGNRQESQQRHGLDAFFGWFRGLGVQRNTDDKWVAGVCSGLANRLGVDPVLVRGGLLLLVIFGGFGLTIYLLAWALLPDRNDHVVAEGAIRHGEGWGIVLLVVIGIVTFSDLADRWWVWTILLPTAVLLAFVKSSSAGRTREPRGEAPSTPPTPTAPVAPHGLGPGRTGTVTAPVPRVVQKRRRRAGVLGLLLTVGLALAAYGVGTQAAATVSSTAAPEVVGLAAALAAAGLALVLIGLVGRRAALAGFLATALAVLAVLSTTTPPDFIRENLKAGLGDVTWVAANQPVGGFRHGFGDATLDLTGATDGGTVTVKMGAGDLTITVPKGTKAATTAKVGVGDVTVRQADGSSRRDGGVDSGKDLTGYVIGSGSTAVTLRAELGAGALTIVEEK